MFELKPLSQEAVARALEKAERYRLLNEPAEAESICEDVLRVARDRAARRAHMTPLPHWSSKHIQDPAGGHISTTISMRLH